jgi:hypothetical protein
MTIGRRRPKRKTFADIDAARRRYNPDLDGLGSPERWQKVFNERIGFEEAQRILGGRQRSARDILGVGVSATWNEITAAFRKKALECHPDRISVTEMTIEHATEAFKDINAAYSVLAHEHRK